MFPEYYNALNLEAGCDSTLVMKGELRFEDEVRKTRGVTPEFAGWSVRAGFVSVNAADEASMQRSPPTMNTFSSSYYNIQAIAQQNDIDDGR